MVWNPGQELFGRRYIIERKLGEGGIGITYLAKNKQGQLRVIKTLREEILNDPLWQPHQYKLKQDFKEEALRLALCRHPHIVEVENVFDDVDLPCMAMEYIEGEDLYKRTQKGALPEAEALQYIRQIGDALILVHEKGLLHRDLKPSNIMMRAGKPEAVLIDFGLARQFISGTVQRHTQNLTHGYAPPEQYAPDAERGEYIDVYALAATLYSFLTGQLPMPATLRQQNFTLQPPKDLNPSISDRVNEAIMKGMALNYKFRPQSVQEWLDLLANTTPNNWECVHTIPGTSPNLAFSMKSIAISPDGKTIASGSKIWDLQTAELLRSYNGYGYVAFSPDAQTLATNGGGWDFQIGIWECSTGELLHTLDWSGYLDCPIAISPNGQFLATSRNWTLVYLVGEDVDEYVKSEPVFPYIGIWDLKTRKLIHEIAGHHFEVADVAFSPDSQILASGSEDGAINLWNVNTGKLILAINENAEEIYLRCFWDYIKNPELSKKIGSNEAVNSITFNPQGSILASSAVNKINLWNPITGQLIRTLSAHSSTINWINFSPDGKMLASGSRDNTIKLWEVNTGNEIYTFSDHSDCVNCVTFSPNGQIIASCDASGNIKIWRRS